MSKNKPSTGILKIRYVTEGGLIKIKSISVIPRTKLSISCEKIVKASINEFFYKKKESGEELVFENLKENQFELSTQFFPYSNTIVRSLKGDFVTTYEVQN
jgi:hypothetical protein